MNATQYSKQILTVCDGQYFDSHAESLIASIERHSPGEKLIIHVYNPNPDFHDKQKTLQKHTKGTLVEFYSEKIDTSKVEDKRALYATHRLFRYYDYFLNNKIDTLFIDIDSLFKQSFNLLAHQYSEADIALYTRFNNQSIEKKILAGTLWLSYSKKTLGFLALVTRQIKKYRWYADQKALYNAIKKRPKLKIHQLEKKYIDWDFDDESVIWTAKGKKKFDSPRYQRAKKCLIDEFKRNKQVAILAPRIDLGFKQNTLLTTTASKNRLKLPIRHYWYYYPLLLRDALSQKGIAAEIVSLPLYNITHELIQSLPHKTIYVPHKSNRTINDSRCYFYMQELYPFFFTLDKSGWGASHSQYGQFLKDSYKGSHQALQFAENILTSRFTKLEQKKSNKPNKPYDIFFPLQLEKDETLACHSNYSLEEVVNAISSWSRKNNIKVLFKYHPLQKKRDGFLSEKAHPHCQFTDFGHIQDLIKDAKVIFTINSGVGFEALLQFKPVVTIGQAMYDHLTFKSGLDEQSLSKAYQDALLTQVNKVCYLQFIEWYLFENGTHLNQKFVTFHTLDITIPNLYLNSINFLSIKHKNKIKKTNHHSMLKALYLSLSNKVKEQCLKKLSLSYFNHKTVALVGNAKSLLNQGYGEEIDSHDIVIRMNLGYPLTSKKDSNLNPLVAKEWIVDSFIDRKSKAPNTCYIVDENAPSNIKNLCIGKDIGFRTSIWSFASNDKKRQIFYQKIFSKAISLWPHPNTRHLHTSLLFKARKPPKNYYALLKNRLSIRPSSGLILVTLLSDSNAKHVTLYGFDFFSTLHIARQDKTKHFLHNPTIEKQAIFEIINRDPTIQIKGYEHTRPSEYYRIPSKVFLLNFSPVNEKYFTALFPYATIDTVPREITLIDLDLSVLRYTSLFIWNYLSQKEEAFLDKHRLKVIRVTDGFIHPNDKKNRFTPPYSWCFDAGGLYFNPNSSSFLFYLLNQGQLPESLRLFGKKVLQSYLGFQTNNSQYLTLKLSSSAYNPKLKKRVLVIGQLKDEPSTIFGMKNGMEDIELIKLAITENPGADIIYRCGSRHPYTHTDKPELSFSNEIKSLVSIASFEISLADILLSIDHVYTMTSYDGFEAILRGIKTTVFGIPFYAGWGLTDDRENILGRHRKLSTLELFITVIILYPRYMTNNTFSDIESIMNIINPIRDHKSVSYAH